MHDVQLSIPPNGERLEPRREVLGYERPKHTEYILRASAGLEIVTSL